MFKNNFDFFYSFQQNINIIKLKIGLIDKFLISLYLTNKILTKYKIFVIC